MTDLISFSERPYLVRIISLILQVRKFLGKPLAERHIPSGQQNRDSNPNSALTPNPMLIIHMLGGFGLEESKNVHEML